MRLGMLGEREGPVAAAFVFDTQPHMMYRHENQTRLEAAREMALWILPRLPEESQVGVLDGRTDEPVFQVDLAAAKQRIRAARRGQRGSARRCRLLDSAAELLARERPAPRDLRLHRPGPRRLVARSRRPDLATALQDLCTARACT